MSTGIFAIGETERLEGRPHKPLTSCGCQKCRGRRRRGLVIDILWDAGEFEESKHPRGKGGEKAGQFVKKGGEGASEARTGGSKAKEAQRPPERGKPAERASSGSGEPGRDIAADLTKLRELRRARTATHAAYYEAVASRSPDKEKLEQNWKEAVKAVDTHLKQMGGAKRAAPAPTKREAPAPTPPPTPAPIQQQRPAPAASGKPSTQAARQAGQAMVDRLKRAVPSLQHTKVYAERSDPDDVWLLASNKEVRGTPQTTPGTPGLTGVAGRFLKNQKVFHIYEITSSQKGAGGKMVEALLKAAPDYKFAVHVDLSGGFWEHMRKKHPDRFTEVGWG